MSTLFRVENPSSMQGLWYDSNGNFNPIVNNLKHGLARDMPMGVDPDFGLDDYRWFSACDSIPELSYVFSLSDIQELESWGYSLYQFQVSKFRRNSWHSLFAREHIITQEKIDISLLKKALTAL